MGYHIRHINLRELTPDAIEALNASGWQISEMRFRKKEHLEPIINRIVYNADGSLQSISSNRNDAFCVFKQHYAERVD